MKIWKWCVLLLLIFAGSSCYSQTHVQGTVRDAATKLPLPYCNIAIKETGKGCISNADGIFNLIIDTLKDELVFSYVGYTAQQISAKSFLKNTTIYLLANSIGLSEVEVHANNDYVYLVMEACRKKIKNSGQLLSKVYFQLETEIDNQAVEMLECYYNGTVNQNVIKQLQLKNGRIGLGKRDGNGYFTSRNTSKAISYLDLINQNDFLPSLPLQFSHSKAKKYFSVQPVFDNINTYHFKFFPTKNAGNYFQGEVWIDKTSLAILKIYLECNNATVHPFIPLFEGGSVSHVNMFVTQTYITNGNNSQLNHIDFSYQLRYSNGRLSRLTNNKKKPDYDVSTTGLMYFYDVNIPFQLPYFNYSNEESDYRKITGMPYNSSFWKNNTGLTFTEKQTDRLRFFNENGVLINFTNNGNGLKGNYNVFEDNNIIWSAKSRISLKANHLDSLLHKKSFSLKGGQEVNSDLYHLEAQIFLDINPEGDSLQHYSATVFNVSSSFYNLSNETNTNVFMNIYFDICEIERQKMEAIYNSQSLTLHQMDSIYKQTIMSLRNKTNEYFKEVETGKNEKALEKWNVYVFEKLGINNLHHLE